MVVPRPNRYANSWPARPFLWLTLFAMVTGGCRDARFQKARQEHWSQGKQTAQRFAAHDRAGPQRMNQVIGLDREQRKRQKESLDKALKEIDKRDKEARTRWTAERETRKSWYRKIFGGQPEEVSDTALKMGY